MVLLFQMLPIMVMAFTISTERTMGDQVQTSLDIERHTVIAASLQRDLKTNTLPLEETLEGQALVKSFLQSNGMRLSPEMRMAVYRDYLQRAQMDPVQFEARLSAEGLSTEAFIENLAYHAEIEGWLFQLYGWREIVTDKELRAFKKRLLQDAAAEHTSYTFEVTTLPTKDDFLKNSQKTKTKSYSESEHKVLFSDRRASAIPDAYEGFLRTAHVGDSSQPLEAFGQWHVVHLIAKNTAQLPVDDAMLRHHLVKQKCLAHLSTWLKDQMNWQYTS